MWRVVLLLAGMLVAAPAIVVSSARAQSQMFRDDAGRDVLLPERPVRIVSLNDAALTVPLLELGVVPVASQGRIEPGRAPFLRGALNITGLDLGMDGMAFLGVRPVDVEAVALARPELILTTAGDAMPVGQLQRIAPTVVIDDTARPAFETYALLARLTGRQAEAARLERRYQAQVAELRRAYVPSRFTVSVISIRADGKIDLEHSYGSLGTVLRDAGFRFPPVFDAIPLDRGMTLSPELLQSLDADFIIDTYRNDKGESPQAARNRLAALHPNACGFLAACRDGRYLVLPRDEMIAISYQSRSLAIGIITGMLAGTFKR